MKKLKLKIFLLTTLTFLVVFSFLGLGNMKNIIKNWRNYLLTEVQLAPLPRTPRTGKEFPSFSGPAWKGAKHTASKTRRTSAAPAVDPIAPEQPPLGTTIHWDSGGYSEGLPAGYKRVGYPKLPKEARRAAVDMGKKLFPDFGVKWKYGDFFPITINGQGYVGQLRKHFNKVPTGAPGVEIYKKK